jgi:PAS domain S-box-containing protein/putative nucleotidyltransferase with HDIG domain
MGRHLFSSLRARLVALVLLAVIPAFGIIINSATARRQEAMVRAREDTLDLVHLVSSESEHMIDSARSLLTLLARLPEMQGADPAACAARLSDLLKHYPRFVNFGVIGPDGRVTASAVPTDEPANLSDRPFFQAALRSDGFQLGHYHVGRITGKPSFNFVLPIRDESGALKSVLFAAQELTSLQSFLSRLQPPAGTSVVVADGSFTTLARHPGGTSAAGQQLPEKLVIILQTERQLDVRNVTGEGGTKVLAGFETLGGGTGSGALHVLVTLTEDVAFAPMRAALTQDLVLLGMALLFVLVAAWYGSDFFLLRHLKGVVRLAEEVKAGNLRHRESLPRGPGELGQLAGAVDDMASAIMHRQEEAARAVRSLHDSEESYRLLFEGNPFPMLVYDPATLSMLAVNEAAVRHYGYARDEFLQMKIQDLHPPEEGPSLLRFLADNPPALPAMGRWRHRRKNGSWIDVEVTSRGLPFGGRLARLALVHDVTAHKRAEEEREALQRVVQRLSGPLSVRDVGRTIAAESRALFRHDAFLFSMLDESETNILGIYAEDTAPGAAEPVEVPIDAVLPRSAFDPVSPSLAGKPGLVNRDQDPPAGSTVPFGFEERLSRSLMYVPVRWEGKQIGVLSAQSYTPGRYDTKALQLLEAFASECGGVLARLRAQQALRESEQRYRTLAETASVGIWHITPDGYTVYINPTMCILIEIGASEELAGLTYHRFFSPESLALIAHEEAKRPQGVSSTYEVEIIGKHGRRRTVSLTGAPLLGPDGRLLSIIGTFVDVTDRKEAQEQSRRQLDRLSALRTIDMTITASMDLRLTLHTLLDQAIAQLHADAADVLRLNPQTQMLNYTAGRGFRSTSPFTPPLRVGEGLAGRSALDRRIVTIPDLLVSKEAALPACRTSEGFASYVVVPLIARGLVKGVLEIYHRRPFTADREWLDFLDAVASQAAIAIDNATLFKELQRSSAELGVAYDSTLEGWSHALDLRDRETVGHSQRVTDVTLRLARSMNINEADLIHIRRGALLHDIGKMGIPDNILHKPGPLTEEEWEIMKKHPVYAFKMLWPIAYLRPALDIPYGHHEKWDGTGYPRRLKGPEIPLAARIFAVVDVWDALSSDRPYRKAWTPEKVRDHVKGLSGTHFDPDVVKAFLEIDLSRTVREEMSAALDGGGISVP